MLADLVLGEGPLPSMAVYLWCAHVVEREGVRERGEWEEKRRETERGNKSSGLSLPLFF